MKKFVFALLTLISINCFGSWETIKGNGVFKKETRSVTGYNGIQSQGALNVIISYGTSDNITVEADENLLPYIETVVENEKLIIRTKKRVNLKSNERLTVHASLTRLTSLVLSGSGNISGDGAFSNRGRTEVRLSGSGNIKLGVDTFDELDVAISGSGNVVIKGNNSNNITAAISGSGNIDCSNFSTNDVFAKVSGSGDIRVHSKKSIDAKVSGSGNIYYKGSASNLNSKSSGSGKIIKS